MLAGFHGDIILDWIVIVSIVVVLLQGHELVAVSECPSRFAGRGILAF